MDEPGVERGDTAALSFRFQLLGNSAQRHRNLQGRTLQHIGAWYSVVVKALRY